MSRSNDTCKRGQSWRFYFIEDPRYWKILLNILLVYQTSILKRKSTKCIGMVGGSNLSSFLNTSWRPFGKIHSWRHVMSFWKGFTQHRANDIKRLLNICCRQNSANDFLVWQRKFTTKLCVGSLCRTFVSDLRYGCMLNNDRNITKQHNRIKSKRKIHLFLLINF